MGDKISIIIPVMNEAVGINQFLVQFSSQSASRVKDKSLDIIVVDGGSDDNTVELVQASGYKVIKSAPGRAAQMNAGALVASGGILLFLHADTCLPPNFDRLLQDDFWPSDKAWGRFDVKLSGKQWPLRMIEWMMNQRSWLTGICTGDQAIFVRRDVFERMHGYAQIALMEDIELSSRLKLVTTPHRIKQTVTTDSRRWQTQGIFRTILLMWKLRLMYFFGRSPTTLASIYRQ